MNRRACAWARATAIGLVQTALAAAAAAHVGSPDTWFEGDAGRYPVRVVVRAPGVVPGLAEIGVRVLAGTPREVTVQPFAWDADARGAPPPDVARPVPGDPALHAVDLWLMAPTSYGIHVVVRGDRGEGLAVVPVQAVATRRLPMDSRLASALAALAAFLCVGLVTAVGAAVGESGLPPGAEADARRRRRGRIAMTGTALVLAIALVGGRRWWDGKDRAFAAGLYRPFHATASVVDTGPRRVRLAIDDPRWRGRSWTPLIPDHGKLMHLFLVRDDLGTLAHLHPTPSDSDHFEARLPPLAAGRYRVYADIVHESGFAQTLTASLDVAPDPRDDAYAPSDPDDAWFAGGAGGADATLGDDATVHWDHPPLVAGGEASLRFRVQEPDGTPATLEPYMGMPAHVVVARADGGVFAHLHPNGTVSMASEMALAMRTPADNLPGSLGRRIAAMRPMHGATMDTRPGEIDIPYAFPSPGRYRVWVQLRHDGAVRTAAFDAVVSEPRPAPARPS